jgi:hypothetical protein
MQTSLQKAIQAEFQAYDVWNSKLQKARKSILELRRKRNTSIKMWQNSHISRKKAFADEQKLWAAETDYATLIFRAQTAIEQAYLNALHGYQDAMGPNEIPEPGDDTTSLNNSE